MDARWQSADAEDDALAEFVAARMGPLLSYAYLLTGDRAAAEDLVQTALAKTAAAWRRVRRKQDPEGYVRRVIVTTNVDIWRRRPWRERSVADVPETVTRDRSAESDERDAMWQALATLPPRQRAVLVLRYYEGLSEAEIAAVLSCSPGTVKSQAAKAMTRLRTQLHVEAEVGS